MSAKNKDGDAADPLLPLLQRADDILLGVLVTTVLGAGVFAFRRGTTRFRTAKDVPLWMTPNVKESKGRGGNGVKRSWGHWLQWGRIRRPRIMGYVTAVNDGDNVRVAHVPLLRRPFGQPKLDKKVLLSECTINVRLAGVDAPEAAHWGHEAQPYSKEAREYLSKITLNKFACVYPHRRDQYERIVGTVYYKPWAWVPFYQRNVSLELLKAGFVTVYTGEDGVFGGFEHVYRDAEAVARKKKVGMWAQDMRKYVSPMDYKKTFRDSDAAPQAKSSTSVKKANRAAP